MILTCIKENPAISYKELAKKTGKSRITISRKLAELKKAGRITRVGADKNGYWRVEDENQSKAHQTDISTAQNNEVGRPYEP
jgi:fic family protein